MKNYRELEIFVKSRQLAVEVHYMSLLLPKFELHEQGSQVRRSSKAVTTSIVEGYSRRRYRNDFIKFLIYSQAECDETIVHLNFIKDTPSGAGQIESIVQLVEEYDVLSRRINKFIQWIENNL